MPAITRPADPAVSHAAHQIARRAPIGSSHASSATVITTGT